MSVSSIDLTARPPRSARVRLGGFVILPRALDKGRAKLAGALGEYHYDCPLDKRFLSFVQIEGDALLAQLATGKGDGEILAWILENAGRKPTTWEIAQWTAFQENSIPGSLQYKEHLVKQLAAHAPARDDILTLFDWLDLDDHLTFGGKA